MSLVSSTILMTRASPTLEFTGYDYHFASIEP